MIQVYSKLSTYLLYQEGQEICKKNQISIASKETIMEHVKRIGMISGPYVKLASTRKYKDILTKDLDINSQLLETRKQMVYDKNS